jgi:hypothetical protein
MKMKTVNIKGKEYVEVKERLKFFRENYKEYSLLSDIVEITENRVVIKAVIVNEQGRPIASGIAYEVQGSSFINKTSFVENCETSAWGRALGNLGIGIDTSIASIDEIRNAQSQEKQAAKKKGALSEEKFNLMLGAIKEGKGDVVLAKMNNYKLKKAQKTILDKAIENA